MKKLVKMLALICVVALSLSFTGCASSELNNAKKLIEEKKYEEAYEVLLQLSNNKEAEELLKNFRFVITHAENIDASGIKSFSVDVSYKDDMSAEYSCSRETNTITSQITLDEKHRFLREDLVQKYANDTKDKYYSFGYEYDEKDRIIKLWSDSDGIKEEQIYSYDKKGNLIKTESTDGISITEYVYDADDNNTQKTHTSKYGGNTSVTVYDYQYDSNKNIIKLDISYSDNAKTSYEYTYNEKNLMTHISATGDYVNYTCDYAYDENGNLILETYSDTVYEYEYDKNNNLIKQTCKIEGTLYSEIVFNYKLVYNTFDIPEMLEKRIKNLIFD